MINMIDEKSPVWIRIFKLLVVLSATAILVGGFIFAVEEAWDFADFMVMLLIVVLTALFEMSMGMLAVNFLNNVQVIREKLEEKL